MTQYCVMQDITPNQSFSPKIDKNYRRAFSCRALSLEIFLCTSVISRAAEISKIHPMDTL